MMFEFRRVALTAPDPPCEWPDAQKRFVTLKLEFISTPTPCDTAEPLPVDPELLAITCTPHEAARRRMPSVLLLS